VSVRLKLGTVEYFLSLSIDNKDFVLVFKDKGNGFIALLGDIVFLIFHEDI
jgi:hypothetical protein